MGKMEVWISVTALFSYVIQLTQRKKDFTDNINLHKRCDKMWTIFSASSKRCQGNRRRRRKNDKKKKIGEKEKKKRPVESSHPGKSHNSDSFTQQTALNGTEVLILMVNSSMETEQHSHISKPSKYTEEMLHKFYSRSNTEDSIHTTCFCGHDLVLHREV